jgi:putative nucleotidyltransferase with HDIG domain
MSQDTIEIVDVAKSNPAMRKLFERIGEVSTLPSAAQRIVQIVSDEDTSAQDLLEALEGDPPLCIRVLRRVNSSFYSLRHQVTDLKTAISLLGYKEIRNLSLTVHVSRMLQDAGDYRRYSRKGLWNHMVASAVASRVVARECGVAHPDEAYLAGMLHDIGLILLDQYLRRYFLRVLRKLSDEVPTIEVEKVIFQFDHAELGAFVARQWKFAEPICDAIRYHHQPEAYHGPNRGLVNTVAVGNYLTSRAGITSLGVQNEMPLADEVYAYLELDQALLGVIWADLQHLWDTANHTNTF